MEDRQHTHVFWFLGVLVALGVDNAATPVVGHFLPLPAEVWPYGLEALRLAVFLVVSVRFLFGAAVHFDEVRGNETPGSYGVDLLSAFFHFFLLFAWSLTIEAGGDERDGTSAFLVLLFCFIGYDLVWMFLCRGNTTPRAKRWAVLNVLTLLVALLPFLAAKAAGAPPHWEETPPILIILLASFIDLAEMTSGKSYLIPMIAGWLNLDVASSPTEPSAPAAEAASDETAKASVDDENDPPPHHRAP